MHTNIYCFRKQRFTDRFHSIIGKYVGVRNPKIQVRILVKTSKLKLWSVLALCAVLQGWTCGFDSHTERRAKERIINTKPPLGLMGDEGPSRES